MHVKFQPINFASKLRSLCLDVVSGHTCTHMSSSAICFYKSKLNYFAWEKQKNNLANTFMVNNDKLFQAIFESVSMKSTSCI